MTISVGDRVKHAIDDVQRGQFELALEHACIAIDVTSKRLYSADKGSKSLYKNLLDEYAWMIELMSLGGVNVNDSIFGNYSIPGYQNPKFKDLVTISCAAILCMMKAYPQLSCLLRVTTWF